MGKQVRSEGKRDAPAEIDVSLSSDIVWEAEGIAAEINLGRHQVVHMLRRNLLPARKVGNRWCSTRSALRKFLTPSSPIEAA